MNYTEAVICIIATIAGAFLLGIALLYVVSLGEIEE